MAISKIRDKWYVKVMSGGRYHRPGIGYAKKEDALRAQAEIKSKLKSETMRITSQTVFLDIWIAYLRHCEQYNSKEWFNAKRYIGSRYFGKWFGRYLDTISSAEIEAHLIDRKNLSARSANLDLEILRNFFNWCVQMDFLDKSPMRPIRKFSQNRPIKAIPTPDVVKRLIEFNTGSDRLLLLLLVGTLGRISEIRRLQWKDVKLTDRLLYLRTRKTRDGSEAIREIPINGRLLDLLEYFHQDDGFVLPSKDPMKPCKDLRKRLKRCFVKAGVQPQQNGFHQFRHYGATMMADAGVPLNVIQDILGHTTLNTTNLYLQSLRESKRAALDKIG